MTSLANVLDPGRAAHASIEGYLYQAYLGVERWLDLKEGEVLRCEGDEDLDRLLIDGSGGISEQVKSLTGTVSIRSEAVRETLRRFVVSHWRLRTADPPDTRTFVFTTTATRKAQTKDAGASVDVLESWEQARTDAVVRSQVVAALPGLLSFPEPGEPHAARRLFWRQLLAALAWLDGDPGRWADLIGSIEWHLGEPRLTGVRQRIRERLSRLGRPVPPDLMNRLLAEVLDASIAAEPRQRVRTREDLTHLLTEADAEIAGWLATDRGLRLVERIHELDGLRGILYDKPRELPASPGAAQLLTAAYEVIPFDEAGRTGTLDDLAAWCADDRRALVRLIHGDGGLGKTRLLIEWCRRLAAQGWLTGFLEPTVTQDELPRLLAGALPRLVVIDYAETRLEAVRLLAGRLARSKDGPKVRLVLLARREGDWWRALKTDVATRDLLDSSSPRELPSLAPGAAARRAAFRAAAQAFASHLDTALPEPLAEPDLEEAAFGRPLYLLMAALAAAEGRPVTRAAEVLAGTLERERRYWRDQVAGWWQQVEDQKELTTGVERSVVILTLLGGLPEERLGELAGRVLPARTRESRAEALAERLQELYAAPVGSGRSAGGLEPDLLGEELVWEGLRREAGLLGAALALADPAGRRQILTVLTRIAQPPDRAKVATGWSKAALEARLADLAEPALEVAVALGDPLGKILAQILEKAAPLALAERIMERCDEPDFQSSVPLREVALVCARKIHHDRLSRLSRNWLASAWRILRGRLDDGEALAAASRSLGTRLRDLGRREEALRATQLAVQVSRALALRRPEAFLPGFARSLHNLGIMLSDLGRHEEALRATQEAVHLYRRLARQSPETYLFELAQSLSTLGNRLSALGRSDDALQAGQSSVGLYRRLARQFPDEFSPEFAVGLTNLGRMLGALGRSEEALQAAQAAVDIYRPLAERHPSAFSYDLARSLVNLGSALSALGRREPALQATQEAVALHRLLAGQLPSAFLPDLAVSLGNLGMMLTELGFFEAALPVAEEAVGLCRRLARRHPETFRPELARNLTNLGKMLMGLGRREAALQATQEAVELHRLLAGQRPETFRPALVVGLSNLGAFLGDLGRREDALAATREAVDISRLLAGERPDAFQPNLASSLVNLGATLYQLDRHEAAQQAAQEAVDLHRHLVRQRPDAFQPGLAASLVALGESFRALGRNEAALQATQEAVDISRFLAGQHPDAFQPNLAMSLSNLGGVLGALGRNEAALQAAQEAVTLSRHLAGQRPDGFQPNLAVSLGSLAERWSAIGNAEAAVATAEEGVRLLAPFFLRHPSASEAWMTKSVASYQKRCEEAGREPDLELLRPIEAALEEVRRS